jgi:hypothetical protein
MSGLKRHDRVSKNGKKYHWYTYNDAKLAGVTTVLGKVVAKPALIGWAAKSVAAFVADNPIEVEALRSAGRERMIDELKEAPYRERDAAADRGTEIHGYAERLVKGEEVEVPPALARYVDSYIRFLDEWKPRPVLVEASVANLQWGYAGQLDLAADLPNGERALLDLKSGKGIYADHAPQVGAYRNAEIYLDDEGNERSLTDLGITSSYIVHVRADGYDVIPVNSEVDGSYKAFLHYLWLYRRLDEMPSWLGDPAPIPVESK